MNEIKTKTQIKTEITKQAKKDIQKRLDGNIQPKKNHIVFEVNLQLETIEKAKFDKNVTITYSNALIQKKENKSITKNKDCIYISAMNKKNLIKKLKRDYCLSF
jgi:ribosome-associated translation inhibitor RaiA